MKELRGKNLLLIPTYEQLHVGNVPYKLYQIKFPLFTLRVLSNVKGYSIAVRINDGIYWVIVRDAESPVLSDSDIDDIEYYVNNIGPVIDEFKFNAFSSDGDKTYEVDLSNLTCNCANFRYKCSHYEKSRQEHLCKHLQVVTDFYPEYLPEEIIEQDSAPVKESTSINRIIADIYVNEVKSALDSMSDKISRYEVVGDYRRRKQSISSIDVLVDTDEIDTVVNYLTSIMGYNLISNSDRRYSLKIKNFLDLNIYLPDKCWYISTIMRTSSKEFWMKVRDRVESKGYTIVYGDVYDSKGNLIMVGSEFEFMQLLDFNNRYPWEYD